MNNDYSSLFTPEQIQESTNRHMEQIKLAQEELKQFAANGQDISEYVWPYAWDYKERPQPHHAKHIINLADAIDLFGERLFSDMWTQEDWYARSIDEIDRWKPEDDISRFGLCGSGNKGANFTNRKIQEKQAYQRKSELFSILCTWLNEKRIRAFTLTKSGKISGISHEVWLSDEALSILNCGKIRKEENGKLLWESDYVYLNKDDLLKALDQETKSPTDRILESLPPVKVNCPDGIHIFKACLLFHEKNKEGEQKTKIGEIVKNFVVFLYDNPKLEIY